MNGPTRAISFPPSSSPFHLSFISSCFSFSSQLIPTSHLFTISENPIKIFIKFRAFINILGDSADMSKRMKLPFIFKNKETTHQQWQWPSCKQPKTLSFRAGDDIFKTVNSVFFDTSDSIETPETWFTSSSESVSNSSESEECFGEESLEMIIRGVQSERLFFEPEDTSSIIGEAKACEFLPFKESVVLAMESEDPYMDFKRSMQEMIETHGLKEWERFEELLGWYLRMNGKKHHGFIVEAFIDLLVGLASSCSDSTSFLSADSSFSLPSSPLSHLGQREIDEDRIKIA